MKNIFIPVKITRQLNKKLFLELEQKLPEKIALFYSIQYKSIANEVKSLLGKKLTNFSQTLGCYSPKIINSEAILLITDGKFHATSLAYETKLPVFVFNNFDFFEINDEDLKIIEQKKKSAKLKFLSADNCGILISSKPGQSKLNLSLSLKKSLKKPTYFFLSNNFNKNEFENFPIDCWINTACPRLDMELQVINYSELKLFS